MDITHKVTISLIVVFFMFILQGLAPAYISRKKGYNFIIQFLLLVAYSFPNIISLRLILFGEFTFWGKILKLLITSNIISLASLTVSFVLPDKSKSKTDLYAAVPVADTMPSAPSPMSELIKYKELLDCGAISEEEYNAFKSEILK